jgi:5-formyltetrahydrofolate cyclo-ligase|tara:strand:- start:5744 stop:6301 length:558 start_codon:yes stop_codon:yes gene_type:complete
MSVKEKLRTKNRFERSLLSKAHVARLSENLLSQWLKFSKELPYDSIALYYPFDNEACTLEIIKYLHSRNKKVLLPVIQNESNEILFAEYDRREELIKNKFGILEPKNKEFFNLSDIDMALIPCVAFNKQLFRLGMGGGFYDRALLEKKSIICIGLAYNFQFEDSSFEEYHDIKMDYIITQNGILK